MSVLFIVLAVLSLQRGTTLDWGEAAAADGARFTLSPVGLSRHATLTPTLSLHDECRWWPRDAGDTELCAVAAGGAGAMTRLRLAYPCLSVAIWLGVGAIFLQVLRVPRRAVVRSAVTWVVGALAVVAIVSVMTGADSALRALSGLTVRYGSPGFYLVILAVPLAAAAGWMQREG